MTSTGETFPAFSHHAPAPWALKASEAWWFVTSFMHKPKQGDPLPISYFGSHETNLHQISTEDGAFRGGMGAIALIRYTETPVGPYDELAIIPGEFANPFGPPLPRCTRIYVSSLASVYNGRRNWNVPNELALFSFLPSFDVEDAIEVRVFAAISYSPVTYSETPFFAALIKPVTWPFPAIPLSLKRLPGSSTLLQPPLDTSTDPTLDGLVGSLGWSMFDSSDYSGHAKPVRCEGLLEDDEPESRKRTKKFANGKEFPDVEPYTIGIVLTDANIVFPEGTAYSTHS